VPFCSTLIIFGSYICIFVLWKFLESAKQSHKAVIVVSGMRMLLKIECFAIVSATASCVYSLMKHTREHVIYVHCTQYRGGGFDEHTLSSNSSVKAVFLALLDAIFERA